MDLATASMAKVLSHEKASRYRFFIQPSSPVAEGEQARRIRIYSVFHHIIPGKSSRAERPSLCRHGQKNKRSIFDNLTKTCKHCRGNTLLQQVTMLNRRRSGFIRGRQSLSTDVACLLQWCLALPSMWIKVPEKIYIKNARRMYDKNRIGHFPGRNP